MITLDDLWGSYITDVSIDLVARRVAVVVTIDEGPNLGHASLVLEGVEDLRITRPSEGWERAELTEVHVSDTVPTRVELVLWTEPDGIVATCASASVDVA